MKSTNEKDYLPKSLTTNKRKSRTLLYMSIFIFLISIGEGMTAPAIPIYGGWLGASYWQLGFLMTGYSITYTIFTLAAGRLSDKIGRKSLLLFSIVLTLIASTGYYFSIGPITLLIFRTTEGMSRGVLWPVGEALIADNTEYEDRGRAMGKFAAAYGAGATLGNLAGGLIMEYFNLTAVFPAYPVLALIVFIIILKGLEEAKEGNHSDPDVSLKSFNPVKEYLKIWPICFMGFAYAGFLYSVQGLLSRVASIFEVSFLGIGIIYALFWGMRTGAFTSSGIMAAIFGRKNGILVGVVLSLISTGTLILGDGFWPLIFAAAVGGLGTGIMFPLCITLIADYTTSETHGFGMGALEFTMGIGMISQTAISGVLGEMGGVNFTYLFTFIVMIIALFVTLKHIKEPSQAI